MYFATTYNRTSLYRKLLSLSKTRDCIVVKDGRGMANWCHFRFSVPCFTLIVQYSFVNTSSFCFYRSKYTNKHQFPILLNLEGVCTYYFVSEIFKFNFLLLLLLLLVLLLLLLLLLLCIFFMLSSYIPVKPMLI